MDEQLKLEGHLETDSAVSAIILLRFAKSFFMFAAADPRIGPAHISMYMALLVCYSEQRLNPIYIFSTQLKPMVKISGPATYHRTIRQLHEYGYIRYVPSFYHGLGSLVYFKEMYAE